MANFIRVTNSNRFSCLVILLSILACTGCQKGIYPPRTDLASQQTLIVRAQSFFETSVRPAVYSRDSTDTTSFNIIRDGNKQIDWKKAYVVRLSSRNAVVVPIHFSNKLSANISMLDSTSRVPLNNLMKLLIYEDVAHKYHAEVISAIPDKKFLYNSKGSFTGVIHVSDWNGVFIRGYQFTDSAILPVELSASRDRVIPTLLEPGSPSNTTITYCNSINWYSCTGTADDPYQFCTYLFTQDLGCTTVSVSTDQGASGSTPYQINETEYGVVASSGSSTNSTWSQQTNLAKICGTYKFTSVSNAWYCEFTNISFSFVGTGSNSGSVLTYLNLNPCFSFPKSLCPTAVQASTALNAAWNQALDQVTLDANDKNVIGDLTVRQNMAKYVQKYFDKFFPGATYNWQGCSGNIVVNKPDYCTLDDLL
ncbi:MAG: hypothetical protein QM733_24580 [Ilumatobacteraceae bacterium]